MAKEASQLIDRACSICGGSLCCIEQDVFDTRFGINQLYSIIQCSACQFAQTWPLLTQEELNALYINHYNSGTEKGTFYNKIRGLFLSSPIYGLWLRLDGDISFNLVRGHGRLLDIGCNEGRNLPAFHRSGFMPEGLEINEVSVATAKALGFPVHHGLIDSFQPTSLYDAAVLSNVLEHSLAPDRMLHFTSKVLRRGGQLLISCPNVNSFFRPLFGRYWINWHVPFHISHFSPESLQRLLEENGFEVKQMKSQTPALWVAHSILSRWYAKPEEPTHALRNPFIVSFLLLAVRMLLFPLLLVINYRRQGDCLVCVAEKR